jgi:hypothetical protein
MPERTSAQRMARRAACGCRLSSSVFAFLAHSELSTRFRPPRRRPSYFSLHAQREVTKRKGTRRSRPPLAGSRRAYGVSRRYVRVPARNSRASCARPCGLFLRPAAAIYGTQEPDACERLLLAIPSRLWRRAAQPGSGERRVCSSAWMREFAPARARRAAQGTARSAAPESGALLFGSFLLGTQEKGTRPPPRRTKPCEQFTSSQKSRTAVELIHRNHPR